ncbi:TssN family type VI secretion system protein [Chitinophaga nivalis]|uniref:TssN family type VI secretion system protein n=1 Tax=Chitinophaga nivalis TaxID=2991709 RepID=A0ABT3IR63_9BACT|nr:TssN family type VI secretion system protein [Chitinophaga nivalis]MCW3463842.1 TssN family type VI secretion system protein [Chitinophaga nivalis]MCW3486468.1 TssN family type VI secretion system protein [Chitinophaga nivalis]
MNDMTISCLIPAGILVAGLLLTQVTGRYLSHFSTAGKRMIRYQLCMIVLCVAIGSVALLPRHTPELHRYAWCESGLLGLGIVHVYMMYTRFKADHTTLLSELAVMGVILLAGGAGMMLVNRLLVQAPLPYYPMLTSLLPFVCPVFVYKTFEKMLILPPKIYKGWIYPLHQEVPVMPEAYMKELIVIGFEMKKKQTDHTPTYFRARTPVKMDLGDLFYHFINDYNERYPDTPIAYADHNGHPCSWVFYRKSRWRWISKVLDPDKAVFMNGIKENSVIICTSNIIS